MVSFHTGPDDAGMRLSRFVAKNTWRLPGALMYKAFRNKRIKVNGKAAGPETRLAAGDLVELYLNDEFFSAPPPASRAADPARLLAPGAWAVIFQDEGAGVLYKSGGVLCHRDETSKPDLLDSYTHHLVGTGGYDPAQNTAFAPALCNRLDKGTEGLLLAAKTYPALREMNRLLAEGFVQKEYLCITLGAPKRQGLLTAWHRRDKAARTVLVQSAPFQGAKEMRTEIEVLQTKGGLALCRVVLHTGRTHQIRAHLALEGACVLGDTRYGPNTPQNRYPAPGFGLCAHHLAFGENIPDDSLFAHWRGRAFTATQAKLPKVWAGLAASTNDG